MSNKTVTFGVIGAMDSEVETLRAKLEETETLDYAGLTFYSGTLGRNRMVLVKSGVGKVNAARCAQIVIDKYTPDYVVNTGIAGGVGEGLAVGDVVIGTELCQHDFDLTPFGYPKGCLGSGNDVESVTLFRSDPALAEAFRRAAETVIPARRVKTGRIATGDVFVAAAEKKRELSLVFGAQCAEMEGCAIAQTAAYAGIPFVVVRAISDLADGTAPGSFDAFEQETADLSAAVIERLVSTF